MRTCARCGFPRHYSRFLEWHGDGTITGSVGPRIPLLFMETEEWEAITGELARTLGLPVDHIVIDAQKQIGKDLYEMFKDVYRFNIKSIPNSRLLRPQWAAKLFIRALRRDISGIGNGSVRVDEYRAGRKLTVRFENPCLDPVVVGNCLGLYEGLEKMPGSKAEYHLEGGDLVVELSHSANAADAERRLYLEEVEPSGGSLRFEKCEDCGVPRAMGSSLSWDIARGTITNPLTGRRYAMAAVQAVYAIMRELERELGVEIVEIMYNAQKRYSLNQLPPVASPDGFWDGYLTEMALHGYGYPVKFDASKDSVSVEIHNSYDHDLYAAKVAAGFEKTTGGGSRIDWESREKHRAKYTISTGPSR